MTDLAHTLDEKGKTTICWHVLQSYKKPGLAFQTSQWVMFEHNSCLGNYIIWLYFKNIVGNQCGAIMSCLTDFVLVVYCCKEQLWTELTNSMWTFLQQKKATTVVLYVGSLLLVCTLVCMCRKWGCIPICYTFIISPSGVLQRNLTVIFLLNKDLLYVRSLWRNSSFTPGEMKLWNHQKR